MKFETIHKWRDLLDRYDQFKSGWWCFRGDRVRPDGFKTSLERAAIDRWGREWSEMPDIEAGLLRRFRREAHLYLEHEPAHEDTIGWLALMRHHGAPTRLLDWSFSFFVAVYFAINRAVADEQPCLWAMDLGRVREAADSRDHMRGLLRRDPNAKNRATVEAIINHSPRHALVFPLNPSRMSRRLILQQSVFVVPGDVTKPFMENLEAVGDPDELVVEIRFPSERAFLQEVTKELLAMNMTSATLFPGLDGFAQNLAALIPFPELRAVDTEIGRE
jgi:hypothetical protein